MAGDIRNTTFFLSHFTLCPALKAIKESFVFRTEGPQKPSQTLEFPYFFIKKFVDPSLAWACILEATPPSVLCCFLYYEAGLTN